MRERYGATLHLFGSRARGTARPDSDYDLVAVSEAFRQQKSTTRAADRGVLWLEAGGWGRGLDIRCLTPEEFREETRNDALKRIRISAKRCETCRCPLRAYQNLMAL